MKSEQVIAAVTQFEHELLEDKLKGDRNDIGFLLENIKHYDVSELHTLIDVAIVNENNTLSVYELLINAIVTPNNERDQFYNKYGVNLEITRNIALQTYAEFYRRTDNAGKINTIEDIYKAMETQRENGGKK
ncbi:MULTISPECIES: hypothetical protein [unclassified Staphylococcus]|uniref:hypothetical protein n=1 Tax=unclassified Staphylococcus TaxID=91994 RepID=UPI00122E1FBE|nr:MULTISPECIES: hypothetical protein [unclassified Staphylococcus]KAA2278075.1 hypothetical protein F1592_00700 [Staphylococcus sp. GDX7P312P]KAA2281488.1 hypothetical protein F1591_03305 [Staphylococcus sp. GDX7P459A]